MVSVKEKRQMLDYIVDGLRTYSSAVVPARKSFIGSDVTNFISVENDGAVILVDRAYTNDSFSGIHRFFKAQKASVATVFYKDGKTFFRSAAQDNHFKRALGFSLKNYSSEETNRMILFRPEEVYLNSRQNVIQYYQPGSEKLDEGIISLGFEPIRFDYSHIDPGESFKPENRDSSKLFIWDPNRKVELSKDFRLSQNLIVDI